MEHTPEPIVLTTFFHGKHEYRIQVPQNTHSKGKVVMMRRRLNSGGWNHVKPSVRDCLLKGGMYEDLSFSAE